jgi:membrane fusion protein, multidrug efflux system
MSHRLSVVTQNTTAREPFEEHSDLTARSAAERSRPDDAAAEEAGQRAPKSRLRWLVAIVLFSAAAIGAFAYLQHEPEVMPAAIETVPPIIELAQSEVFTVDRIPIRETVHLSGTLRPLAQSVLKAEVGATVQEVLVREGQSVKKGDVLARLDTAELTSRLTERQQMLQQAKAQLALAEKSRAIRLKLVNKGLYTSSAANEVESTYQVQLANVQATEAQVEIARKALDDATIQAPIAGIISERSINPGEKVSVDGKLLTIVDLSAMEVEAMVSTSDIAKVAVGQPVEFLVPGLEQGKFNGEVLRINPTTRSGTRSIPVHIRVHNEAQTLREGTFVTGEIAVGTPEPQIAVPVTAIRNEAGGSYALKLDNGVVQKQPLTISSHTGGAELVPVLTGLAPGDKVISAPSVSIEPGTKVRIGVL